MKISLIIYMIRGCGIFMKETSLNHYLFGHWYTFYEHYLPYYLYGTFITVAFKQVSIETCRFSNYSILVNSIYL